MFLPTLIAELPTPAVDLIAATDGAGGAVMVFDADDRIVWANPAQRSLMPCGDYDTDETYESLFWKLLETGLNGSESAKRDPKSWLTAAIMTRRYCPNLNFINKYRGRATFVSHLRLDDGTSVQARLDIEKAGLEGFLNEFGGSGILFALRCKEHIESLQSSLDGVSLAVAIVDTAGGIVLQNASFRDLIAKEDGLRISQTAGIVATDQYDDLILSQSIRNATSGAVASAIVPIRRPAGRPLLAAVTGGDRPGTATIVLSRFGEDEGEMIAQIRRTLGTTPAEAEIAYAVGSGQSIAEIAESRETTEATVYTQLKRIRAVLRDSQIAPADLAGIAALVTRVAAITRPASKLI